MKRSWFSILLVLALLGLLGLLATLQYRWLGQISDGERERLQKRLQMDTGRFAEDFNNEMRKAYFNFQLEPGVWKQKNWRPFNEQFDYWKTKSPYPALVTDFYFVKENESPLGYDANTKSFVTVELPAEINELSKSLKTDESFDPIAEKIPALIMPVYEDLDRLTAAPIRVPADAPRKKYGFLIIRLDRGVIEKQILPALTQQYFSGDDGANYRLSVVSQNDPAQVIFKNHPEEISTASDSSAKLFSLSPEKMAFFVNRDLASSLERVAKEKESSGNVVVTQRWESKTLTGTAAKSGEKKTFNLSVHGEEKPRIAVMESNNLNNEGIWLLNVQHRDGSLEQFITNTRNRNLAVSFGILSLLAVSVVLIFLSAQRAKKLAQRQMDFVSSVSHEFRTPLAVIYSAGENLTDGVVNSDAQVAEYGTLIKHEGKKLSGMVEQILEFAGARSGRRKYDLRQTGVGQVLSDALQECQPLIDESGFTVEKNIPANLPPITADEKALSHAFQNLINNAIKYSRDDRTLRITAENGAGMIKLSFEDHGRGIPAREQSQIFEPFFRGKEVVAAQIHGNGLGLSLVKQIVEALGGRVKVESRPGEGSKFIVELPV